MLKNADSGSTRNRLALFCFALLCLVQLAYLGLEMLLEPGSLTLRVILALGLAVVAGFVFRYFALSRLARLRDAVNVVHAVSKGDLTCKADWSGTSSPQPPSMQISGMVEQKASELAGQLRGEVASNPDNPLHIGTFNVPTVSCGSQVLGASHGMVDNLTSDGCSVATLFVRRGDAFVRVSTSLKRSDGSRAVGTMLDRTRPPYKSLIKGEPYSGVAQLFGKHYLTRYTPLKTNDGSVAAALFVGVEYDPNPLPADEIQALGMGMNNISREFSEFVATVQASAESVSQAAAELAANTDQVAGRASQQSEAANASVAAVSQMSVSIEHIAERARNTEAIAVDTSGLCDNGGRIVDTASRDIGQIADSVTSLFTVIDSLRQRSNEVGGIVRVIREIAEQTNLLALNAAIEAARAGESGRGFAVVADEVRKLAERTGQATHQITGMIDHIQKEIDQAVANVDAGKAQIDQGVRTANQASDSLGVIKESSHQIEAMIREISASTYEQGKSSAEITRNVETIFDMSKETSKVMAALATSAASLEQMASNLQNMAGRFRV